MPGGRPTGSRDQPRERAIRQIEEAFAERGWGAFKPLARMAVLAEEARQDLDLQAEQYAKDQQDVRSGELPPEMAVPRVTNADRNVVHGMYQRTAEFFYPKLKAQDVKIGGLEGSGPITVVFGAPEKPESA